MAFYRHRIEYWPLQKLKISPVVLVAWMVKGMRRRQAGNGPYVSVGVMLQWEWTIAFRNDPVRPAWKRNALGQTALGIAIVYSYTM